MEEAVCVPPTANSHGFPTQPLVRCFHDPIGLPLVVCVGSAARLGRTCWQCELASWMLTVFAAGQEERAKRSRWREKR